MITLIIFLCIFSVCFITLGLFKVPIVFKLKIDNNDLSFSYKAFFKERFIQNKITEFIKSGSAEFDKNILLDVSEVVEIEKFKTDILVSTPLIHVTNIGVLILSWIVPAIYRLPFRKKEGLYFKVIPRYKEWKIKIFIDGKISVSLISLILIFLKVKRRFKENKLEKVSV